VRICKSVLKCPRFCSSRFWGFHNSADEDSSLMGFYAVSNCKESLVFWRSRMTSSQGKAVQQEWLPKPESSSLCNDNPQNEHTFLNQSVKMPWQPWLGTGKKSKVPLCSPDGCVDEVLWWNVEVDVLWTAWRFCPWTTKIWIQVLWRVKVQPKGCEILSQC